MPSEPPSSGNRPKDRQQLGNRRGFLRATLTAAVVGTAGCGELVGDLPGIDGAYGADPPETVGFDEAPPADHWVGPERGPGRTRHAPGASGPSSRPTVAWEMALPRSNFESEIEVVAATPETVVTHHWRSDDDPGVLAARDPSDGTVDWERTAPHYAGFSMQGSTLYGSRDGADVWAISAAAGTTAWEVGLASLFGSAPTDGWARAHRSQRRTRCTSPRATRSTG